jgi:hypothetical protein
MPEAANPPDGGSSRALIQAITFLGRAASTLAVVGVFTALAGGISGAINSVKGAI